MSSVIHRLRTPLIFVLLPVLLSAPASAQPSLEDPLPSWNDGPAKEAILTFVSRVTTEGSPDFLPVEERVAVFDNDGTLWPEKPLIQGIFVLERLRALAREDPSLWKRQPFQAALERDLDYFKEAGPEAAMEILALTHSGMTDEQFEAEVREFFAHARHPHFGVPYTELAYRPMVELLEYLRAHGFTTYISSGGGIDFIRVVSEQMYGIPPEQVIGSSLQKEIRVVDGEVVLWRKPALASLNDKEAKPVNIDLHIGKRPVLAVGNVRSGGDISMLEYSQGGEGPSLQLLINHDDAERESAYQEPDNASLRAAQKNGWTVVSMQRDWKQIFSSS